MSTLNSTVRTTVYKLQEILDSDLTDLVLNAYINTASNMVDANLVGKGLNAATLADIEKWLAAHLISATREMKPERERIGDGEYSVTYQGKTGMGLEFTAYGQMAKHLDTSGTLAKMGLRRATFQIADTPVHGTGTNVEDY